MDLPGGTILLVDFIGGCLIVASHFIAGAFFGGSSSGSSSANIVGVSSNETRRDLSFGRGICASSPTPLKALSGETVVGAGDELKIACEERLVFLRVDFLPLLFIPGMNAVEERRAELGIIAGEDFLA